MSGTNRRRNSESVSFSYTIHRVGQGLLLDEPFVRTPNEYIYPTAKNSIPTTRATLKHVPLESYPSPWIKAEDNWSVSAHSIDHKGHVRRILRQAFIQMLYIYRKHSIQYAFHKWRQLAHYERRSMHVAVSSSRDLSSIRSHHYHITTSHDTVKLSRKYSHDTILTRQAWQRTALVEIFRVFRQFHHRAIRHAFLQWVKYVRWINQICRRCFDEWQLYIYRFKLLRLNCIKAWPIVLRIDRRIDAICKMQVWEKWTNYMSWYKSTIRVRLFFRLWRSYAHRIRQERRALLPEVLRLWKMNADDSRARLLQFESGCFKANQVLCCIYSENYVFVQWLRLTKRRSILRQVVSRPRLLLHRAFRTWKKPSMIYNLDDSDDMEALYGNSPSSTVLDHSEDQSLSSSLDFKATASPKEKLRNLTKLSHKQSPDKKSSKVRSEYKGMEENSSAKSPNKPIPRHHRDCKCHRCRSTRKS